MEVKRIWWFKPQFVENKDGSFNTKQTKEEVFYEIMKGIDVSNVGHLSNGKPYLTYFMKDNPATKTKEFFIEYDNETNTVYFSYLKLREIIEDVFGMNWKESYIFLSKMFESYFNLPVKLNN